MRGTPSLHSMIGLAYCLLSCDLVTMAWNYFGQVNQKEPNFKACLHHVKMINHLTISARRAEELFTYEIFSLFSQHTPYKTYPHLAHQWFLQIHL